jgi:hypothetical protein
VKNCNTRGLASAVVCLAMLPLVACTGLPTSTKLESAHTATTNTLCESSKAAALSCARYLRDEFAGLESKVGGLDTAYALTAVGLGSLTAVYLKSSSDRTQALEDLAVGVATLAGVREVLKPGERIKIATEGRKAVECMIQSVDAITVLKAEVDTEASTASAASEKAANLRQAFETQRIAERHLTSARQSQDSGSGRPTFARKKLIEQAHAATEDANKAAKAVRDLRADSAPLTPMQRFEIGVDQEFGLEETHRLARSSGSPPVDSAQLQVFARGLLLQQQGRQLATAKINTRAETTAADSDQVIAQRLAFGLHQVLNNARLSIGNLSAPGNNVVIAQRDAVRTMLGDLAKTVSEEQKQSERTIGAANAAASSEDTNAAANDAAAEARSAGRIQLQQVFEKCTGGAN